MNLLPCSLARDSTLPVPEGKVATSRLIRAVIASASGRDGLTAHLRSEKLGGVATGASGSVRRRESGTLSACRTPSKLTGSGVTNIRSFDQ
jgi:hypothetical protein